MIVIDASEQILNPVKLIKPKASNACQSRLFKKLKGSLVGRDGKLINTIIKPTSESIVFATEVAE